MTKLTLKNMEVKEENEDLKTWCESIGRIVADAMLDVGLIEKERFEDAVEVAALELFCRMLVGDYPPPYKPKQLN